MKNLLVEIQKAVDAKVTPDRVWFDKEGFLGENHRFHHLDLMLAWKMGLIDADTTAQVLTVFIENGMSVDSFVLNEEPLLINAVKYDYTGNVLNAVLRFYPDPNVRDREGNPAIYIAIRKGKVEAVKTLLKLGADPLVKSAEGLNVFDYLVRNIAAGPNVEVYTDSVKMLDLFLPRFGEVKAQSPSGEVKLSDVLERFCVGRARMAAGRY